MEKITRLALYIINSSKKRRLILGISAKAFGRIIGKSEEYVQNIESSRKGHYSHIDFPTIAAALDWQVHNLLPPDNSQYSDGTLVDKVVFSLINPSDAKEVIVGMKEIGYFKKKKSLKDIFEYLYLTEDMIEKRQVINDVLEKLTSNNVLKLQNGNYIA